MIAARPASVLHSMGTRARVITHPGPVRPLRIQSATSPAARHFRLLLQPGATLWDAFVAPFKVLGVRSASTTILAGHFSQLHYCVAPPDPEQRAVIAYTRPENLGPAFMVFGNATIAVGEAGKPVVHCHAVMQAHDGLRGGHVVPHLSVIGNQPITVLVTTWSAFELRVAFDEETNIPLIQPYSLKVSNV